MGFGSTVDLIGVGMLLAALGLMLATLFNTEGTHPKTESLALRSEGPIFLFDGDVLVDCNASARAVLSRSITRGGDWQRLLAFLAKHFDNIDEKLSQLPKLGALAEIAETNSGKAMLLQAELSGGLTKIALIDPDLAEGPCVALAMSHRAMETEVQELRHAAASSPVLMWRESPRGEVTWANNAYVLLASAAQTTPRELSWPLPRLFDRAATLQSAQGQRQSVAIGAGKIAWFDLVTQGEQAGMLCFATPADAAVNAENTLRDFMQTLSKTFAQLPIGLAIFDKERKLQMFNPALVELTTLPPDFLTRRPSMLAVLDAMRDRNLLPEPKDYHSWRRQIIEMERAAASGLFQENWALPDGQTFRVTGRPHPNGGIALMIEDISGEMQRSRRYRSDLEISQSVIDQLEEAIVVFDQSGHLLWCNTAYSTLWDHDPAASLGDSTIRSVTVQWKTLTAPTQLWIEIDEFIHTIGNREAWSKNLRLLDGRLLTCAVAPLAAGSTMVAFRATGPMRAGSGLEQVSNSATAAR
jgi:PAS domain-containing protein